MSPRAVLRWVICAGAAAAGPAAAGPDFVVPPEFWDRPRSAATVLAEPVIRDAVRSSLRQPGARLVVRHGPLQESRLAAEELRLWLAALGVDPARIGLRGDLEPRHPLRIEVIDEPPGR